MERIYWLEGIMNPFETQIVITDKNKKEFFLSDFFCSILLTHAGDGTQQSHNNRNNKILYR